jgi:hypothetical protein
LWDPRGQEPGSVCQHWAQRSRGMQADLKETVASLSRETRRLELQHGIKVLDESLRLAEAPLVAEVEALRSEIRTTEFSLRMSLEHREAAGKKQEFRNKIIQDETTLTLARRALERAQKRLDWVRRAWGSVLQSRRSELDRVKRSMKPGDNLLRASEIGVQQAEPPPSPLIKHEP